MTPDPTLAADQGETSSLPQPLSDVYISPATQRLLGIRMEGAGAPAQTTPPTGGGQGQGQGDGGAQSGGDGGGFNWGMFPDVPEDQRALLEPHLRGVQGHVTKLEQQYAPYKGVLDSGIDPEAVQGLIALNQAFDKDPMGTWLQLAANMQKSGALSDDLDLDAVRLVLEGKAELEAGTEGGEGGPGAGTPDEVPQWAREIMDENKALREEREGEKQSKQAEAQQQQLEQTLTGMKAQLKEAGYTDEQIGAEGFDDLLTSAIITAKGDPDAALKQILMIRDSTLKGLQPQPNGGKEDDDLDMPNGAPKTPKRTRGGREFAKAREGATQFLRRQRESSAAE